jgi:hypothetical protein
MAKLLSRPALLMSESKEDYQALQAGLEREIMPRSFVESIYVDDIAALSWEILRLRAAKLGSSTPASKERWSTDSKAKKEVAELLRKVRLDDFSIEAEAIRLSSSDLELLDRMLSAYESRRNKALRSIEDYRVGFANTVRKSSDRVLQEDRTAKLGFRANKVSA